MAKLTKRTVDNTEIRTSDYVLWDDELPGFGLRVFASGKRSYVVQYRASGRSRRFTIGLHGVWTPEEARREAKVLLGQVARGGNPAEERKLDREAITVKELCTRYLEDLRNGLVLGKRGRPKKATTISTDVGRIERHIVPLLGNRRVRDLAKSDITQAMKDIMAGKTRANVKTDKLRGRAIVRGGAGTAARTIGLFGGILSFAVELGITEQNPVHGVRKPKDQVNARRLSEQEYRTLGEILRNAGEDGKYRTTAEMIRVIALTGCRRSEVIGLQYGEVDIDGSCLRLTDSKEERQCVLSACRFWNISRRAARVVRMLKTTSFPAGRMAPHSGASPGSGRSCLRTPTWPASRRIFSGTASLVSAMTLDSPRLRSLPWSGIREAR